MNLSSLYAAANLPPDAVLNVYLTGSRAWGTATERSDWDLFVIVAQDYNGVEGLRHDNIIIFDNGVFNLEIMKPSHYWDTLIQQHHNIQCLATLFSAPELVWKETVTKWREFKLDETKLIRAVLNKCPSSFNRAKFYSRFIDALIATGDDNAITGPDTPEEVRGLTAPQVLYKGKKMIFHSLRYLVFAHQLLETGRIYDFKAATVYWDQLKDEQFLNWDYYQTNYYPIYRGLLDKLPSNKAARKSPEELESVPSQFHRMFYLDGTVDALESSMAEIFPVHVDTLRRMAAVHDALVTRFQQEYDSYQATFAQPQTVVPQAMSKTSSDDDLQADTQTSVSTTANPSKESMKQWTSHVGSSLLSPLLVKMKAKKFAHASSFLGKCVVREYYLALEGFDLVPEWSVCSPEK